MKKFLAMSLSIFLLFSNMGLTFGTHYCGGPAVESRLMLGKHVLDCGMLQTNESSESGSNKSTIKDKSCCENEYITCDLDDTFSPANLK